MFKNKLMMVTVVVLMVLFPACAGSQQKPDEKLTEQNTKLAGMLSMLEKANAEQQQKLADARAEAKKAKEESDFLRSQQGQATQPGPVTVVPGQLLGNSAAQGASLLLLADQSCLLIGYTETYPLTMSTEVRRIKSNVAWTEVNAATKVNGKPVLYGKSVVFGTGAIPTDVCGNFQLLGRDPHSLGIQVMGADGVPVVIQPERIMIGKQHGKPLYTWVYTITIAPFGAVDMATNQQGSLMAQYIVTDAGKLESVLLPYQVAYLEAWEGDVVTAEGYTTSTDPRTPARGKKQCGQKMVGRQPYVEICG